MGGAFSKKKAIVPSTAPDAVESGSAADLGKLLSSSGIVKVVLIRHANAAPRNPEAAAVEAGTVLKPNTPFANAWTVGDLTRDLTDKGREQASAAKGWLDAHKLKGVITSEAARAYLTKDIMAPGTSTLTLHTLHPSRSGTPECEKMFDTLGYGTLNTYFADRSVPGCEGRGKAIFRNYQSKVTRELHQLIAEGLAEKVLSGDGDGHPRRGGVGGGARAGRGPGHHVRRRKAEHTRVQSVGKSDSESGDTGRGPGHTATRQGRTGARWTMLTDASGRYVPASIVFCGV